MKRILILLCLIGAAHADTDLAIDALLYQNGEWTGNASNVGTTDTPCDKPAVIGFYLDGLRIGELSKPALLAGETWPFSFMHPVGLQVHQLQALIDDPPTIAEPDEQNNMQSIQVGVPDLNLKITAASYQGVQFQASVKNTGLDPITGDINVAFQVGGATQSTGLIADGLPPGTTKLAIGTGYTMPVGTHQVVAVADSAATVAESDEGDNSFAFSVTVAPPPPTGGPDLSTAPPNVKGSTTFDVVPTALAPTPTGTGHASSGKIRPKCMFAKTGRFDPIVAPGVAEFGHLHTFFGNDSVTGASTAASLMTTGGSTCVGGTANRSSYWVPTLYDKRNGKIIMPTTPLQVYYQAPASDGVRGHVNPLPSGLRMIAGNSANSTEGANPAVNFSCRGFGQGDTNQGQKIPACPGGSIMRVKLSFPECWDGANLDSPDHKSHMANAIEGQNKTGCETASHPKRIPGLVFFLDFDVNVANESQFWRVSSDMYGATLPGGLSFHGDVFGAWDPKIMKMIVDNCVNPGKDCGGATLGKDPSGALKALD